MDAESVAECGGVLEELMKKYLDIVADFWYGFNMGKSEIQISYSSSVISSGDWLAHNIPNPRRPI